jgi:hypothetical protein
MRQGQQVIHHHNLLVHFRKILDLWFKLLIRICKVDCRFIKFLQASFYKPNRICCRLIWFQWPYNKAMMHLHMVNWVGFLVDVVELSIGVISWIVPTIFNSDVATNHILPLLISFNFIIWIAILFTFFIVTCCCYVYAEGPILCSIALRFKGHIPQILNPNLMFCFVDD